MEKNKLLYFGVILSVGFIATAIIGGFFFLEGRKTSEQITVTGSARLKVVSDSVKWTSNFSRTIFRDNLKGGYSLMKDDEKEVVDFLKNNGLKDEEINISPVMTMEIWNSEVNSPKEYSLSQNVEIRSFDVEKIKNLSKNIQSLIDKGVFFTIGSVEYYYTKLPDTRVNLLPEAIKDAQKRAGIIASASGKEVGDIKSVDTGSVQVLVPNSVDVSDYGSYDTSSIEKEIMVTVHPVFKLK